MVVFGRRYFESQLGRFDGCLRMLRDEHAGVFYWQMRQLNTPVDDMTSVAQCVCSATTAILDVLRRFGGGLQHHVDWWDARQCEAQSSLETLGQMQHNLTADDDIDYSALLFDHGHGNGGHDDGGGDA